MKLCVIGGAGARSAFLTKSLVVNAKSIRVDHIVLLDCDPKRLSTYGTISRELARRLRPDLRFDVTDDAEAALQGANYIITTVRAGGDEGRLFDEKTCLSLGVLGQETTGAGGFAMAIRSVPVLRDYCELARKVAAPEHIIFNFTNPSGIVTQALRSLGYDQVYGICDAPSGFIRQLEEVLGIPFGSLDIECYGLNHLSWFRNARYQGKDVQSLLLDRKQTYTHSEMRLFTREMARLSGDEFLNEYLYFYYRREHALSMIQKAEHPRGEMICQINRELEEQLNAIDCANRFEEAFSLYMQAYAKRENAYFAVESGSEREQRFVPKTADMFLREPDQGGYAAVALQFIHAVTDGKPCRMVLSVPNDGAIEGLADEDVVEISCDIREDGAHPVRMGHIDDFQLEQIRRIKYFERCTVKAALDHDRYQAIRGLTLHPLINDMEIATRLVDLFFAHYLGVRPEGVSYV